MSDDQIQAILAVFALLALLVMVFVPVGLFLLYAYLQKRKRNQIRERLIQQNQQFIRSNLWFPVRYASERRFKELFKIFPWEGAGIIVIAPGSAVFLGQTFSGNSETLQFAPGNSTLHWLGKAPWPNGAVSWFYFSTINEKHYFSSETGILVFGSHKSTRAIYDSAFRSYSGHSASGV